MSILWIILAYLMTLLITFGIKNINLFLLVKDIAYLSLKVDFEELDNCAEEIDTFNLKKTNIESFIPLYNIFKAGYSLYEYLTSFCSIIDDLEELYVVIPMPNFEKYAYLKKPNIINLFKVLIKGKKRLDNACYFSAIDKEGEVDGIVYYEKEKDINILDIGGTLNNYLKSDIIKTIETNDSAHYFSNFIHYSGNRRAIVTENKEILDKIDEAYNDRNDKVDKLRELKRFLSFYKKIDYEDEEEKDESEEEEKKIIKK